MASSRTRSRRTATRSRLDALVVLEETTFPGCRIACRPIGIFAMEDEKGTDNKILTVPIWDERREIDHVSNFVLTGIRHFFDVYKDIESGKYTRVGRWLSRQDAEREVRSAQERHAARGPHL